MTREIKFRFWLEGMNTMEYKDISELDDAMSERLCIGDKSVKIMQFTGLKDVKGKEIYEGDIVSGNISETARDVVLWDESNVTYILEELSSGARGGGLSMSFASYSLIVVGNIYENPELIE